MDEKKMEFFAGIKSIWVSPLKNEDEAPEKRIVHGKYFKLRSKCATAKIGFRNGTGYFKCGSVISEDYVTDFQLFAHDGKTFRLLEHRCGLPKPSGQETIWFKTEGGYSFYYIVLRKSGVDGWFPCYNTARSCVVFSASGDDADKKSKKPVRNLHKVTTSEDISRISTGDVLFDYSSLSATYSTPFYKITFRTKSAGLDYFSIDGAGDGKTSLNLLAKGSILSNRGNDYFTQGFVINPIIAGDECLFMSYEADGETIVGSNYLIYKIYWKPSGLFTEIRFTMNHDRIDVDIHRHVENDLTAVDSSPFRMAFNAGVSTVTALGDTKKAGETGALSLPSIINFPGLGSLRSEGTGTILRFNSIRPHKINTLSLECGEESLDEFGLYHIKAGKYNSTLSFTANISNHIMLSKDAPVHIREALDRFIYSGVSYRADTDELSNNGISICVPLCSDLWADLCDVIGNGPYGVNTLSFLGRTLEKRLEGYPGYASGKAVSGDGQFEDEYVMTDASLIYATGKYLAMTKDLYWYEKYRSVIEKKITQMKTRDIDDDGIVESLVRKGISGDRQWGTNWYDVISYGYKDAFSNAILYGGLTILSDSLDKLGSPSKALEISEWASKLKTNYKKTFMTKNGWLAGWMDAEYQLHDYGFMAVNGAAVSYGLIENEDAKRSINALFKALIDKGFDAFEAGLPANIFDVPDEDCASEVLPFGGYENGGLSLSQARHFINAMYKVGMNKEADSILSEMCKGLLRGNIVGGMGTGSDWKTWDGVSCGYEGILCDQFGIFETVIKRYKA